ncbi:hypothetical protein QQY79_00530 [Flavobacterium tructae]|uniref:hypothetical protein n=1 Tax=Flavobacterium TaxID=237 RepID=UPI00201EA618|nr:MULTISPECIES: hypothetical protein [Flavobacterium]MDL2140990.1 hypothetical protein [Flavobacterium tructae]URC13755.1 hypothetical protein M4I44_04985 [Flavobacterium sp. B183]
MKLSKFIFISLVLLSLFGCKKKEVEKVDELRFEKGVLNNVFVEIVDSIYMDRRIITPPPFPKRDFKTNIEDTTGYHAELKKFYHHRDSIKNDKTRILLSVYTDVEKISSFETEMIHKQINISSYTYDISKETDNYKIDLRTFESNKKFNFQNTSKYPDQKKWDLNDISNVRFPVGTISVSRIQFNKTKTRGILSATASCGGGKCGRGFLIIIENKSRTWKIAEVIHTWVS